MPRYPFTVLLALGLSGAVGPAWAQQPASGSEKLVDEGLELYRNDKNDDALTHFQQALKLTPNNSRAQYGTALVYYTTGRYAEAAGLCESLVKRGEDNLPNLYVTYGTSLDRQQKSAEAVQVYQRAIRKFPQDEPLRRYQGIALLNLERYDEAAESFQQAVRLQPNHATTHLQLAQVEAITGSRVPALLACVRSLMTETSEHRAAKTVSLLDKLLQYGVKQTGQKSVTLDLTAALPPAGSPEKSPNSFAQADMLLTLTTALDYDKENKDKAPAERLAEKFTILFRALNEQKFEQRLGFNWQFYAPFFIELEQKGYVLALAYIVQAMRPEVAPEVTAWVSQHPDQLRALSEWSKAYQWPK